MIESSKKIIPEKTKLKIKMKKVWIAGHKGMVGRALVKRLSNEDLELIYQEKKDLNLLEYESVSKFLRKEKPDMVFIAAGKVGGILANNNFPASFIYENLAIASNIINSCHKNDIQDLIYLGSSCIYPRDCKQPIKEEYLLTGELEKTNQWYAIAKISGLKLCEAYNQQYNRNYLSVQPTNLYGPHDNFNLKTSHVLPALLRKVYEAKKNNTPSIEIWGTGKSLREFLYVDDLADALFFLSQKETKENLINIGSDDEISIIALVKMISSVLSYECKINFDLSKPDGTPRKKLDTSKMKNLGWQNNINLEEGISLTLDWFTKNLKDLRK